MPHRASAASPTALVAPKAIALASDSSLSEFRQTERAYGGRRTHAREEASGLTALDYDSWLLARTPSFKDWFGDWERLGHRRFLNREPAFELDGTEFAKSDSPIQDRVEQWYQAQKYTNITVHGLGVVSLDRRSIENSLSHGHGRYRIMAFAAVPYVLRLGRIIYTGPMRSSADGQVYHLAAPIFITGKAFVASVLVRADSNSTRPFTHQVFVREKLQNPYKKDGAVAASRTGKRSVGEAGAMWTVLRDIYSVNPETVSPETNPQTGEPLASAIAAFASRRIHQGPHPQNPT